MKNFQKTLAAQQDIPWQEVLDFLQHWLIDHLLHADMEIKAFLAAKKSSTSSP